MKHEVSSREVYVDLTDAPRVEGTTTGLNLRTIEPVKAVISTHRDGSHRVLLRGPQVRANGTLSASWFDVKVNVDPGKSMHADAPKWVHALVAEVER